MNWTCGIITVPCRRHTTLPRTLASLARAGFERPRLFIDGSCEGYGDLGLPITFRAEGVGAWGNWVLGLYELYVRQPQADRYAMFQDDVVLVSNVRQYLDRCHYPRGKGWWNLYSCRNSEWKVIDRGGNCGWIEGALVDGDSGLNNPGRLQKGIGALALVFDRECVLAILEKSVGKACAADRPTTNIDGQVAAALNSSVAPGRPHGYREFVHGPSLANHIGKQSTASPKVWADQDEALTFPGETWDASQFKPNT